MFFFQFKMAEEQGKILSHIADLEVGEIFSVGQVDNTEKKSFLDKFDPRKVGKPRKRGERPPMDFDSENDPRWERYGNADHLIDAFDKSVLANWSERFTKPCFYEFGYLFLNPDVEGEAAFHFNPEYEPFKVKPGTNTHHLELIK